jgi:hypothetical protein
MDYERLCSRDFHSNGPGLAWSLRRVGLQVPIKVELGKFPADFPQIPNVHGVIAGPDVENLSASTGTICLCPSFPLAGRG